MDMANDRRTGNCNRLNSNGMSVGIRRIRVMVTNFPFTFDEPTLKSKKYGGIPGG